MAHKKYIQREIKGFELSEDYQRLWDLIHDGYRIPAWIVYQKERFEEPIYDLVEVKMAYESDRYSIGVRGTSYDTWDSDLKSFEMNCKIHELRWIVPTDKKVINPKRK